MRDNQKGKLYAAEAVLSKRPVHFRSLKQVQSYVDKIVGSGWWSDRSDVTHVAVVLGRKDSSKAVCYPPGHAWRGKRMPGWFLTLPPTWATTHATVLHELAHVLTPRDGHGPGYCEAYVEIVKNFMGQYSAGLLEDSMRQHGCVIGCEARKEINA